MNALEMAEAMEGRARVRRKITNRENTGDRLSDQLEQAAAMLRQQQEQIDKLASVVALREMEIESLRNQLWDLKSEPWGFDRHLVKEDVGHDYLNNCIATMRKAQEK